MKIKICVVVGSVDISVMFVPLLWTILRGILLVGLSLRTTVGDLGVGLYLTNLPIIDHHQIIMTCQPVMIFSLSDSPWSSQWHRKNVEVCGGGSGGGGAFYEYLRGKLPCEDI